MKAFFPFCHPFLASANTSAGSLHTAPKICSLLCSNIQDPPWCRPPKQAEVVVLKRTSLINRPFKQRRSKTIFGIPLYGPHTSFASSCHLSCPTACYAQRITCRTSTSTLLTTTKNKSQSMVQWPGFLSRQHATSCWLCIRTLARKTKPWSWYQWPA